MTKAILDGSAKQALVITPKSQASISRLIMDIVRSELSRTNLPPASIQQKCLASLERIMLSVVFDTDGLWQTVSELQTPGFRYSRCSNASKGHKSAFMDSMENLAREVEDTKENVAQRVDDSYRGARSQLTTMPNDSRGQSSFSLPDIIVITHFSTLLTSLFAGREKSAAHQSIALLKAQLRLLSNCSATNPLILLLNSNTSEAVEALEGPVCNASCHENPCQPRHVEPTLRSLFMFPLPVRPTRPSFGLVFSQILDLHLLCTNVANLPAAMSYRYYAPRISPTLVEVLRDESSRRFKYNSKIANLEQRWAVLEVAGSCIVNLWQD